MRQSTVIFGSIMFAFVVYITMRGHLPAYIDLFKPGADGTSEPVTNAPASTPNMFQGLGNSIMEQARKLLVPPSSPRKG